MGISTSISEDEKFDKHPLLESLNDYIGASIRNLDESYDIWKTIIGKVEYLTMEQFDEV